MTTAIEAIGRLDRATLGDRVYRELRELLMAGKLMPGEKLSLRPVAASLGVSMMPVREAVARLVAEEALVVSPNRSIRVPLMSRRRFRELKAIRLVIEGYAAEQAALLRSVEDLAAIRRHDAGFRRAVTAPKPDPAAALGANMSLHFAVYRAAASPSLTQIIEGLWLKVGPVINYDLRASTDRLAAGAAEVLHAQLLAAIEARDAAGARAAVTADISSSADYIEAAGTLPD
jgi:DNA-binding GntR family transcriptional regulator